MGGKNRESGTTQARRNTQLARLVKFELNLLTFVRLQKQPFPPPPPNAIRSHSSKVIFRKSRNSADGHISQCYFEHGPPVKIQEVTAKELKFGYCNMFD